MKQIVKLSAEERSILFTKVSESTHIPLAMIEKDFWVCFVLAKIFSDTELRDALRFKGGTSLSKGYGLIKRFSEDLDLILDKSLVLGDEDIFKSSYKKQREFADIMSEKAATYISTILKSKIENVLDDTVKVYTDAEYAEITPTYNPISIDNKSLHIVYPKSTNDVYLRPDILLEIGIMPARTPCEDRKITSYVAQALPQLGLESCIVPTVKPIRTFWDKATILHREFYRPAIKYNKQKDTEEPNHTPARYSRHYHDLYQLGNSFVKDEALADRDLLADVVDRKDKLYHCPWAKYDECLSGKMHLLPNENNKNVIQDDYKAMQTMIYGEIPTWDEIIKYLAELEKEINQIK